MTVLPEPVESTSNWRRTPRLAAPTIASSASCSELQESGMSLFSSLV